MILFLNVFITKNFATAYDRGNWQVQDRLDVFKYSLASMAAIPWTEVIIYCQLDECYKDRRQELNDYVVKLFPKVNNYEYRLSKQSHWQKAMEEVFAINDEFVWFSCNDDHVFLDYELDTLNSCVDRLQELMKQGYKYVSCYMSHWPEMLCHSNYGVQYPVLNQSRNYFEVDWINIDSIQIVNKAILKHWWFNKNYGEDVFLIRTDGNIPGKGPEYIHIDLDLSIRTVIPLKELARHFDGYCRHHMFGGTADINRCTPLSIPEGFFENNVKISFCREQKKSGYVHVNPFLANYSTVDPQGADYKWMLEDVPLFWRDKISEIDFGPEVDREVLVFARNHAVKMLANSERAFLLVSKPVPVDWLGVALR